MMSIRRFLMINHRSVRTRSSFGGLRATFVAFVDCSNQTSQKCSSPPDPLTPCKSHVIEPSRIRCLSRMRHGIARPRVAARIGPPSIHSCSFQKAFRCVQIVHFDDNAARWDVTSTGENNLGRGHRGETCIARAEESPGRRCALKCKDFSTKRQAGLWGKNRIFRF